MAAAYSPATFFLLPSSSPTRFSTKLFVLRSSSVSSPLITRFRKQRKNYLRPKILRTRPDPFLLEPSFTVPEEILVDPQPDYPLPDPLIEEALKECDDESLETFVSDVSKDVRLGKFSKFTVFRVGLFLVGAFVVQTICAVLLFGSGQNGVVDSEDESRVLGLSGNGVGKSRILVDGNKVVYVDEVEMRRRIKEIQVMARDVREKERRERKNGDDEDVREDDVGGDVSRIEKEIIRRLGKSGKGVKKKSVGKMRKLDDVGKGDLVAGDFNEGLLVKKAEFENLLIRKVEDFRNLDDDTISEVENGREVLRSEASEKIHDDNNGIETANADVVRNDLVNSEEQDGSRTIELTRKKSSQGKERVKLGKAEPLNGKAVKLQDSDKLNGASSQRSKWWLNLPYVLAVVMRTGSDDQGANGLYRIRSTSHSWDDSSHVVAFEDRGDATNFCYLLQSFFEDLDSFDTDIIPIPIKELDEAVKSHSMELVVVKKGQLKLYAGQPLPDVEMALRSLVEQS